VDPHSVHDSVQQVPMMQPARIFVRAFSRLLTACVVLLWLLLGCRQLASDGQP
jgi:hypothetical protein